MLQKCIQLSVAGAYMNVRFGVQFFGIGCVVIIYNYYCWNIKSLFFCDYGGLYLIVGTNQISTMRT